MIIDHERSSSVLLAESDVATESRRVFPDSALERSHYLVAKRLMDLALVILGLLVLWPLLLLIAIGIKLHSEGPVIFTQERIGYDPRTGTTRPFRFYKFRSMRVNCDDAVHRDYMAKLIHENIRPSEVCQSLKLERDPRITGLGRLLRRTSLDELPQLFNVLKGDMSLVGPRPALPYEVALYEERHRQRLLCRPGITGWWQVMGRNRVSFDEGVAMDIWYIQHRSLALDLRILFIMTPWAVISAKGAG
jgi:lipopolysaccharide/colanic/teichoic acid biosynthesis glycosyltransferase